MLWYLVAFYLFVINAVTFAAYGIDKSQARERGFRLSESFLLMLGFLGGSAAALAAQRIFHHKTRKFFFLRQFWATVVLQITLIAALWIAWGGRDVWQAPHA